MLRITAARRIAAARRAAETAAPVTSATSSPLAPVASAPGDGIPAGVAIRHTLPGAIPIDPQTGRPYPVSGAQSHRST
jgi:hypothetical protein